jgi:hypothetical protein
MTKLTQIIKTEHPGDSLEGMRAAEDVIEQTRIYIAIILDDIAKRHQVEIELFKDLFRFSEKVLDRAG